MFIFLSYLTIIRNLNTQFSIIWSFGILFLHVCVVLIYLSRGSDVPDADTVSLPCTEVGPEDGERPKKKRKEQHREGKTSKADSKGGSIVAENKVQQDDLKAAKLVLDFSMSAKAANEK